MNQARLMKALADETRLRVMNLLLTSKVSLCVCEIVDALGLAQYQVSRHLIILKNAELVSVEKRGTWAYHSVKNDGGANSAVIAFLQIFLTGERFEQDQKQLKRRLRLREDGKCVVGFPAEGGQFGKGYERRRVLARESV